MIGPVFTREAAAAPRRASFFAARTLFVATLFAIALTSWQLLVGSQRIENIGDLAWFGAAAFQILASIQLAVAVPFSALLVSSAVALEKDRKTLDLLLLTNLSNTELVLGKLLAGMLSVIVVVVAAWPLFLIVALLGGVSANQIVRVQVVTLASTLAAGSLGSLVALWREKTFQALAMTILLLVLWIVGWEIAAASQVAFPATHLDWWAAAMSPWQAVQAAARPAFATAATDSTIADPVGVYVVVSLAATVLFNIVAIARVRVWNPAQGDSASATEERPRESATGAQVNDAVASPVRAHSAGGKVRPVWDNPILWREIKTWSYGKRILIIRLAYWAVFAACALALFAVQSPDSVTATPSAMSSAVWPIIALLVVGLILLNALAVTSLTNERDSRALDLLLVTDLSPKEIVFGKLGGAFYNAKEMILLPLLLCVYLRIAGEITTENLLFFIGGLAVMTLFAAMLGLHAGITYSNSRTAIAISLGTLLFLFLGIATCMRIMLAFSNSFDYQLTAFAGFIAAGSVGLWVALNWRTRSPAITVATAFTPLLTFVIMTSFLLGHFGTVFLITVIAYGFATWAMLIPAIYVFDVATGRTVARED